MATKATNNWQALGAGGLYGTQTSVGGGGNGVTTSSRDQLDYLRMGSPGRTPEAQYPDGYLNSANGRQQDKLLAKVKSMNARSYQRGVHKGERIDPGDYVWAPDWNPETGIDAQLQGRQTQLMNDGMTDPTLNYSGMMPPVEGLDPHKRQQMARFLPTWS